MSGPDSWWTLQGYSLGTSLTNHDMGENSPPVKHQFGQSSGHTGWSWALVPAGSRNSFVWCGSQGRVTHWLLYQPENSKTRESWGFSSFCFVQPTRDPEFPSESGFCYLKLSHLLPASSIFSFFATTPCLVQSFHKSPLCKAQSLSLSISLSVSEG